jgi:hypothetical protein
MVKEAWEIERAIDIPYSSPPDIAGCLLLQERSHFLDLASSSRRIVEEVAQLARIGLYVHSSFCRSWIAFQYEDLMLRTAFLSNGVHRIDVRNALSLSSENDVVWPVLLMLTQESDSWQVS